MMILIGEPTVGAKTGLFTPPGIILFFFLYLCIFHLFESIIVKYKLVIYQVILLTFAIYSVLVTGLLNKELTEFVLQSPIFPALIRIQASFFIAFAFILLNRVIPRDETKVLSIKRSIILSTIFVLIISISGTWGLPSVLFTIQTVPLLTLLFVALAIIAVYFALHSKPVPTNFENKKLILVIYFYLLVGAIPNIVTFLILLTSMITGGFYLLLNKQARSQPL